eukprot:TRINITY_DN9702_c0_g1_i2.p1 TRINITY_DN9702_c0_g1~~TRINITY_DN9702_c0_g1_i2.p1  ORF type:complete len:385 (+),score=40.00 TRINITY_DN9702_c0_g1_i2:188-1342(+)
MQRLKFLPRHRRIIFLSVLGLLLVTMLVSILTTLVRFSDEGNTKFHVFFFNASINTVNLDDTTASDTTSFGTIQIAALHTSSSANAVKEKMVLDKFLIEMDFYSVDVQASLIKARVHITVPPSYRTKSTNITNSTSGYKRVPSASIPNTALQAVIGSKLNTFPASKLIEDFDVTISINGDLSDYPFDSYNSIAYFSLYLANQVGNKTAKLPIGIAITGALQGFKITSSTAKFMEIDGSNEVGFMFELDRSPITVGFSTFITTLMWLISLVMFTVSLDVVVAAASSTKTEIPEGKLRSVKPEFQEEAKKIWKKKIQDYRKARQVSAPLLAMPVALIFALPALRNVQPGVPQVGAYCDVVGFFWNVGLVAISAVCISSVWLVRRDV